MSYTPTSGVRIAQLIGVGASGYLAGTTVRVAPAQRTLVLDNY